MSYSKQDLTTLKDFYKNQLLNDTVSFWLPRSFKHFYDKKNGEWFGSFIVTELLHKQQREIIQRALSFTKAEMVLVENDRGNDR